MSTIAPIANTRKRLPYAESLSKGPLAPRSRGGGVPESTGALPRRIVAAVDAIDRGLPKRDYHVMRVDLRHIFSLDPTQTDALESFIGQRLFEADVWESPRTSD